MISPATTHRTVRRALRALGVGLLAGASVAGLSACGTSSPTGANGDDDAREVASLSTDDVDADADDGADDDAPDDGAPDDHAADTDDTVQDTDDSDVTDVTDVTDDTDDTDGSDDGEDPVGPDDNDTSDNDNDNSDDNDNDNDDDSDEGDDTGAATDSGGPIDGEEVMLEYAQCMRDNGVEDYPDPEISGDGAGVQVHIGVDGDDPDLREADEACKSILDEAMSNFTPPDPEEVARMQEEMLEFAECMREHGIDFPDPQISDEGMVTVQVSSGAGATPMDDPEFQEAQEACGGQGGPMFQVGGT